MATFKQRINRAKLATERQIERFYERRTKLMSKYILWESEKQRFLFLREDVDRFCTELKKLEEEREDLKDMLEALNRINRYLHGNEQNLE